MKWFQFWKYREAFRSYNNRDTSKHVTGEVPVPPSGGRVSAPDGVPSFMPNSGLTPIASDFALEWLDTLENLCSYHPDVSYAMDNIVQLANTKHKIAFADGTSDSLQREMLQYINENESKWYDFSGGGRGLKADILAQTVINGALSAEVVPAEDMKSLYQVYRVAPKNIQFVYDSKIQKYHPYQKAPTWFKGALDLPGLIKLNPLTYRYIAVRRIGAAPYALPPFISAIKAVIIKEDILKNFALMMEKLGAFGFVSVTVKPPTARKGEQPEAYAARCSEYLSSYVLPQVEKSMSRGVAVGFIDTHKFEVAGNKMNVNGAEGIMKMIDLIICSGLKQDPNMLNRNYSSTETFGRVILTKMLSQTSDYQMVSDKFYEFKYMLSLRLAGFNPKSITVESEQPLVGDRLKEAQADKIIIENVIKKRDEKIIDQTQAAHELDYDEAADPDYVKADPVPPNNSGNPNPNPDAKDPSNEPEDTTENKRELIGHFLKLIGKNIPAFPYSVPCCNHDHEHSFDADMGDSTLENYRDAYLQVIDKKFKAALDKIEPKLKERFKLYTDTTPIEYIQVDIYATILQYWKPAFVDKIGADISKYVEQVYDEYRKDQSIFSNSGKRKGVSMATDPDGDEIPDAIFDLTDFRTMQYMESSDQLYLGKFITDDDTRNKMYKYIRDNYIDGHLPIGKGNEFVDDFFEKFKNMVGTETWKIRRIIDTTVVKARTYANLHYMNQSHIDEYEIIEAGDSLSCEYCLTMNGKTFKVSSAVGKIRREVSAGPERIATESPFVTSLPIDQFRKLTDAELEARGFVCPAYHPHCRGRVIANIKF